MLDEALLPDRDSGENVCAIPWDGGQVVKARRSYVVAPTILDRYFSRRDRRFDSGSSQFD
jgi:hypothetical protein